MVEWHLTPEYIFTNWTDEKLDLMIEKLIERKQIETGTRAPKRQLDSEHDLLIKARHLIKVVKVGD